MLQNTTQNTPPKKDRKELLKMPNKKLRSIEENLGGEEQKTLNQLIQAIESSGLEEFTEYIRSPWKMILPNLIAGVARGVGTLAGAALVIAIIGWILASIIDLPLIGKELKPYINNIQNEIQKYTEDTNYKSNFQEIERLLDEIHTDLQKNPK